MAQPTPSGTTPPAPGLDREEPDLWVEDDIPSDDGGPADGKPAPSGDGSDQHGEQPQRP